MIAEKWLSCGLAAFLAFGMQSLADLARQEAERRKALDEQGIQGKVIEADPENLAPDGNLTTSTPAVTGLSRKSKPAAQNSSRSPSAKSYRSALQKLDRSISRTEERLQLLRSRLQDERWAPPKVGRLSRRSGSTDSQSRIQAEIENLEIQLKQMRKERAEIYDAGRKDGFLPGELDGKGIIP
jgi:hypothetical protein